jgi:uncharacterized membrane protein YeaQ/YmgE (transglycosylase-associated protein family)
MAILSFILYLLIAAACAYIGERLVPGSIPGGFLTSAIVGIIGAWLGGSIMGPVGPDLGGVALIPCIIGSALLVFICHLLAHGIRRGRAV